MGVVKDLPWFRFYKGAVEDEKLLLLAKEDRWDFVALLCCKAKGIQDTGEEQALIRRKIAIKLGVTLVELEQIERRLSEVGLIEVGSLQPIAWDRRQFKSDADPTNAERQRRHRTRNGRVTGPDTDTEADTEEGDKSPSGPRSPYSDDFERAWSLYPKRPNNNKSAAWRAWQARIRSGEMPDDMIAGVMRYQVHIRAADREGTNFVKQASTFFGPDSHYKDEYEAPRKVDSRQSHRTQWNVASQGGSNVGTRDFIDA